MKEVGPGKIELGLTKRETDREAKRGQKKTG